MQPNGQLRADRWIVFGGAMIGKDYFAAGIFRNHRLPLD
jgi:hypothetical protein